MITCNFSIVKISRPISHYFAIKEVLASLDLSFLSGNVNVITCCKQGDIQCEHILVVSMNWV